ncbi:F-box/WD repeat-containing protein 7-like isoform X1 [Watersipora subatra]|uniref:F-box/WD repeat-containing protein 7-like isoform X1 n=2 Tax=Watersipora subatra TaxID=2589382 RepID=UPI00355C4F19
MADGKVNESFSHANIKPSEARRIFESSHDITLKGIKQRPFKRDSSEHSQENCVTRGYSLESAREERIPRRTASLGKSWSLSFDSNKKSLVPPQQFRSQRNRIREWFSVFSEVQKNLMLNDLLEMCNLPQMHLLSIRLEGNLHLKCPPNCMDWMSWLPQPIASKIFSYLDPVSLCQASRCCWSWYEISHDRQLWKSLSHRKCYTLSPSLLNDLIAKHTSSDSKCVEWKKVFAEQYHISSNWRRGRCFIKVFEGHTECISCVQFDDKRIVSGSWDTTIKVWNIRSNSVMLSQTLTGHSQTVRCLHLSDGRLVSGSNDSTLKVWDLDGKAGWSSIACKATMVGHTDSVRCLDVNGDRVISGSYDNNLKVWDILTGQCMQTLSGHSGKVLCVQSDEEKIISGSSDTCIKVWTYDGQCISTMNGHTDAVTSLQFDSKRIISGSFDWTIKFWDLTGTCIRTIDWISSEGHTQIIRCIQADGRRLVSGSDDKTIKVWSLETGKRLVTLRSHGGGITCLQFSDTKIVSGSYDKRVLLWDFAI